MAGRPKRRARIAAQWAEVERAAGRTSNAGRPKRRARLAAEAAARGAVSAPAAASVPSAHLTDLIAARDAAAALLRRATDQYYAAKGDYRAAQRNDYIDQSVLMDAERDYYATVDAMQDAKRDYEEAKKAVAAAGRTPNAGRPKRRARIAAQWAEVDRMTSERAAGRVPNAPFPDPRAKARKYEVVVGELGTLYSGPSKTEAEVRFGNLARLSDAGDSMDLIRGSDVRLYCDGVLLKEHLGSSRSRTRNAGRPKREPRVLGLTWDEFQESLARTYRTSPGQPYRKRNGQRYRVFESLGRSLSGPHLILVDTEAHEGFYPILYLGVHDDGGDDLSHTEVQAVSRNFDPTDYTFGREIPLSKVPARFRKYVKAHIAKG